VRPSVAPRIEWRVDRNTAAALLAQVSSTWARLGEERPYWSVLASDQFLPENASSQREAFYQSGAGDTAMILEAMARIGCDPGQFPVFFEFGCGLGRVTSHLYKHFRRVIACDISPSHLAIARSVLQQRGITNVELRQAIGADFGMSDRFNIWFSRLVLQHNSPPLIALILKRAFSLLASGGIALFQVPIDAPGYRFNVKEYMKTLGPTGEFEMHALPQQVILDLARGAGCRVLELNEDAVSGPPWTSRLFVLRKQEPLRRRLAGYGRRALFGGGSG